MATEILVKGDPFLTPLTVEEHRSHVRSVIQDMVIFTNELVLDTETAYRKMTSIYKQAREWKKSIESKRKEMVDPFRKQMSQINDKAKELTDPLDSVIDQANAKVEVYQKLLEEMKRLEDAKIREKAAIFDASESIYIPPMEKIIRGDGAIAVTKTEKRFRVLDLASVPEKYLMVNEKTLMQDIKLGISEVSGIEIYEETTTQLRVR